MVDGSIETGYFGVNRIAKQGCSWYTNGIQVDILSINPTEWDSWYELYISFVIIFIVSALTLGDSLLSNILNQP